MLSTLISPVCVARMCRNITLCPADRHSYVCGHKKKLFSLMSDPGGKALM